MTAAPGVPLRPLVALTFAVLCVHGLALQAWPGSLGWAPTSARPALLIRALLAPPAPPQGATGPELAAAAPPQAEARAVPRRSAHADPRPPSPMAGAAHSELVPAPSTLAPAAAPVTAPTTVASAIVSLAIPGAARWHYDVTARYRGQSLSGQAELLWRPDAASYEAQLLIKVTSLPTRVQRSTGRLGPNGLRPDRFSERHRGEEATHFDHERGRIVFSSNRPDAQLLAGAQDRLSILLQLAAIASGDPARLVAGTSITVPTAGTREADEWQFVVDGRETLTLAAGRLEVIKLTRAPRREYDLRLEVWLGPGPDYAPMRLRLTPPNGDWLDLQWSATDKS